MLVQSLEHAWPPFALVTGLLLIGAVAHGDGLFAAAGRVLERVPGPPVALFIVGAVLVVGVTAVLNLDTAVVFLTPVILLSARHRGVDEEPFLYMSVFMANAGSLFLPGANLTNLLVIGDQPGSGASFASRFALPAAAAALTTLLGLLVLFGRRLAELRPRPAGPEGAGGVVGVGLVAAVAAGVLTVIVSAPALPVLGVGVLAAADTARRHRTTWRELVDAIAPAVLVSVLAIAVVLGVLARDWDGPARLIAGADRVQTAALGALASVLVNNLPGAVLLSAQSVPHPQALLVGLNLGPNLAVTGSLSAYLWIQSARQVGAHPSVSAFSRRGVLLAPVAMLAALLTGSG